MIGRLTGQVLEVTDGVAVLAVGGVGYEVHLTPSAIELLGGLIGQTATIHTYHYIVGGNQASAVPTLVGFSSRADREFFERLITVPGIGPKAAAKAMALPCAQIAGAIEREDIRTLKTLPGIGDRTAREVVATLKGKVSSFVGAEPATDPQSTRETPIAAGPVQSSLLEEEAIVVLEQLGYRRGEAERMVADLVRRAPSITSVEDLIQELYR